ncbi:unnamed protein product, partial [Rotaria sp. Silwood2]
MSLFILEPSLHTVKQRRWRANRKDQPHLISAALSSQSVQPASEQELCSSSINESFNRDVFSQKDHNYDFDPDSIFFETNESNILEESNFDEESDEPLYDGARVTVKYYHKQILEFGNGAKLDNTNMNKLLKLIESALPFQNKLVKSCTKLFSFFQKSLSFIETLRCSTCLNIIDENNYCSILCEQNEVQRRADNFVEHVFIDRSNHQLIETIRRNKHLILNYPELVDKLLPCDVLTRVVYQEKRKCLLAISNDIYPITCMLHVDGASIFQWSKKHTWLVMASILEIPPPLRENQQNMLLLAL